MAQQHHSHNDHQHGTGRVLGWSLIATVAFVVVQVIAGFKAGSLALLSDAGHNFTDALALGLAAFGFYLQAKPANDVKTYGYHRAGVLAAFVNALSLLFLSAYIFYESYKRLLDPQAVQEWIMLWIAGLGLMLNLAIMFGLRQQKATDINIRAAWAHMLGDALGSVAIIIGASVIHYTAWYWVDPVLSILIGALIVWTAWDIVKESLNILLEGLPAGLALADVTAAVREVAGVLNVHDLHIWTLGSNVHALSCHVLIDDQPHSSSDSILRRLNTVLHDRFGIDHTTIQFEHAPCPTSESGCCLIETRNS